jgi:hypothetical protein
MLIRQVETELEAVALQQIRMGPINDITAALMGAGALGTTALECMGNPLELGTMDVIRLFPI